MDNLTKAVENMQMAVSSIFDYTRDKLNLERARATNGEVVPEIPTQYGISLPFDSFPQLEEWNQNLDEHKPGLTGLEVQKAKRMWTDFVSVNKSIWIRYRIPMLCKSQRKLHFA